MLDSGVLDSILLRLECGVWMKLPCVYLIASKRNGTLYVGVTSDLVQRVWQHKNDVFEGFTKRYRIHALVWYETCGSVAVWKLLSCGRKQSRDGNGLKSD